MNQTAASLLIVASSIFGYGAGSATHEPTQLMLGAAALSIGLWGGIALVASFLQQRDMIIDSHARLDLMDRMAGVENYPLRGPDMAAIRQPAPMAPSASGVALQLPPDLRAQLSVAAKLRGQDREAIIEELLRRHLPQYTAPRAA